jgi:hypothetical protein
VTAFVGADLRYLYPLLPVLVLTIAATIPTSACPRWRSARWS